MRLAIVGALCMLQGCAVLKPPEDWSRRDTVLELTYQTLNVIDYRQTADIRHHPDIQETNPVSRALVGPNPSSSDTAMLMATYGLSHYLISKYLPKKWRPYWQSGTALALGETVHSNHALGLRVQRGHHNE